LVWVLLFVVSVSGFSASQEVSRKKDVLIITEVGLSHALVNSITEQIAGQMQGTRDRNVEFYSESLDLMAFSGVPFRQETRDWLIKKYGGHKLDVVVAVGPDNVDFPVKTLEVALRLFPGTRYVYVVGGSSAFDKMVISRTRVALSSVKTKAEILYLTEMEMGKLLKTLQELPDHSIVIYTSFFQDSAGNRFLNATKALPVITAASNGPDFGMSDTYLGHGIVGGYVMPFEKQGKITAQIVSELLEGKKPKNFLSRLFRVSTCSTGTNCRTGTSQKTAFPLEV
jgi:hypothetical protein